MTQKTGFAYHPDYLNHDTGPNHPERPDRLRASLAALQESEVWEQLHPIEADTRKCRATLLRARTNLP